MTKQSKVLIAVFGLALAGCLFGCNGGGADTSANGPKVGAATPGGGQISVNNVVGRKPRMGPRPSDAPAKQ